MTSIAQKDSHKITDQSPNKDWSFEEIGRSETNAFSHGYHRYPAKFIPQIVDKLIKKYTKPGDLILDPYGGCGTTLVEAKLHGRPSIAFDINPVAKFITQTKTTPIKPVSLENYTSKFFQYYTSNIPTYKNKHQRLYYWFDEEALLKLDKIYSAILRIKDDRSRRFFLCAFSHILKNCSYWLMKSTKPTINPDKIIPNPMKTFMRHLEKMKRKNKNYYDELSRRGHLNVFSKMYRRNSTKNFLLDSNSTSLIVTSPPYVTSYEYANLHELTLLWFGSDPDNFKRWSKFIKDFDNFRKKFVGTNLSKNSRGSINSQTAEKILRKLRNKDKILSKKVSNYFVEMNKSFKKMSRVLKQGGKLAVVMGNTQLKGVDILNAEAAIEQIRNTGLKVIKTIKRETSSKMITPWRDPETGKFTSPDDPDGQRIYQYEYIIIAKK